MKIRVLIVMSSLLLILVVIYFIFKPMPQSDTPAQLSPYIWQFDTDRLVSISIRLPQLGKKESWSKKEDLYWYFDDPENSPVNLERWDGGIPLILSGPRSVREIPAGSGINAEKQYGLDTPAMIINLLLDTGEKVDVLVGDRVPDGSAYYIKLAGNNRIFTIDESWMSVLERLVHDPPYNMRNMN